MDFRKQNKKRFYLSKTSNFSKNERITKWCFTEEFRDLQERSYY